MKKLIIILIAVFVLADDTAFAMDDIADVSAKSAIVVHADSGSVLYEKQADARMLIASTTKIMTGLIAIESCDLSDMVLITEEMSDVEGSSMYLKVGETYTVRELLYGLMLASGNDAATAIAIHVAGDESAFAELMNQKAAELGMFHTSFENPHGLDSSNHYSTAKDMAILASYAMDYDIFAEIVGTRHISIKNLTYVNHNKLLWQCEGVTGVKTGYTKAAGRALVSCCEREGQRLICVTLSAPDDWNDHMKLYEWVYDRYRTQTVIGKNTVYEVPLMNGNGDTVSVEPLTDVTAFVDDKSEIEYTIELPRFVFGPVFAGDRAGQIIVTVDGEEAAQVQLIYKEDYRLNIDEPSGLERLIQRLQGD